MVVGVGGELHRALRRTPGPNFPANQSQPMSSRGGVLASIVAFWSEMQSGKGASSCLGDPLEHVHCYPVLDLLLRIDVARRPALHRDPHLGVVGAPCLVSHLLRPVATVAGENSQNRVLQRPWRLTRPQTSPEAHHPIHGPCCHCEQRSKARQQPKKLHMNIHHRAYPLARWSESA